MHGFIIFSYSRASNPQACIARIKCLSIENAIILYIKVSTAGVMNVGKRWFLFFNKSKQPLSLPSTKAAGLLQQGLPWGAGGVCGGPER